MRSLLYLVAVSLIAVGCASQTDSLTVYEKIDKLGDLIHEHNVSMNAGDQTQEIENQKEISALVQTMVNDLIWALEYEKVERRMIAAAALGFVRDQKIVDALMRGLEDQNPSVRSNAAMSIGAQASAQTQTHKILKLLDEESTRLAALVSLSHLPATEADVNIIDKIHPLLEHPDPLVRNNAMILLGKINDISGVSLIIDIFHSEPQAEIRENATLILSQILHPNHLKQLRRNAKTDQEKKDIQSQFNKHIYIATPFLIELLKDKESSVVRASSFALQTIHKGEYHGRSHAYWMAWWDQTEHLFIEQETPLSLDPPTTPQKHMPAKKKQNKQTLKK